MSFASKLKQVREKRKMTQRQLSEASGVTITQISGFENGDHLPSYNVIVALCNGLDCKPNSLIEVG